MEEYEKNQMAQEAAAITDRAQILKTQKDVALGAHQFFKDNPDLTGDGDLIGVEVAKIPVDFSEDPVSNTYHRLEQAAKRVRERKVKMESPDNISGDVIKTPNLPPNPKEEEEVRQGWVDAHTERQKKIRLRF